MNHRDRISFDSTCIVLILRVWQKEAEERFGSIRGLERVECFTNALCIISNIIGDEINCGADMAFISY